MISGNYQNLGVIIPGSAVENFIQNVPAKYEPVSVSSSSSALEASSPTPEETNNQDCQSTFGAYSEWTGKVNSSGDPLCQCQAGYSWDGSGNECVSQVSLEQLCQNQYGVGSYSYQEKGKAICGCSDGYEWNSDQTACVPQQTYAQQCQNSYGIYSEWSGQTDSQGKIICDCQSGYAWNADQTQCVIDQNAVCAAKYPNSYWNGTSCGCPSNYTWNSNQTACESDYTYCQDTEGYGATYNSSNNSCECKSGYIYNKGTAQCEIGGLYCSTRWGIGAEYDYSTGGCALAERD